MLTTVTIDGTPFDGAARCAARWNCLDSLTLRLDGYGEVAWTLEGVGPNPPYAKGQEVTVTIDGTLYFRGDISYIEWHPAAFGWAISFRANDLRRRGDSVPLRGQGGGGRAVYNRSPVNDPLYVASDAGLTVGEIVERVIEANAAELDAVGIGNFGGTPPTYTLPAATVADLALLDVVPPRPVTLGGDAFIGELASFIETWHPKYVLNVEPDGTIRVRDIFAFTPEVLEIPGDSGTPDPVGWPQIRCEIDDCFTKVTAVGRFVDIATLSTLEGTLIEGWDPADELTWTIDAFERPLDGYDVGDITAISTTTATVESSNVLHAWASNFWSGRQGHITLVWMAGNGIEMKENRAITTNTALTAGGTSVITWDSTHPLPHLNFDAYTMVATAGAEIEVGRLYYVREPNGPEVGIDTYIGPRLEPAFLRPMAWANNGRLAGQTGATGGLITSPLGMILYSQTGAEPYYGYPATFEIVPSIGAIRFHEPVVKATASPSQLRKGYPTSYPTGKPYDVVAIVAYLRDDLTVTVPTSGFEGTAYDECGHERELLLFIDDWTLPSETANITKLCQEHLDVIKDVVYEGSIVHRGLPAGFDPLTLGYALELNISGTTSPWDGISLPVRSVTLMWPQGSGITHLFQFEFSNRRRPFQGDDLYVHPADYPADRDVRGGVDAAIGYVPFQAMPMMDTSSAYGNGNPMLGGKSAVGPTFDPASGFDMPGTSRTNPGVTGRNPTSADFAPQSPSYIPGLMGSPDLGKPGVHPKGLAAATGAGAAMSGIAGGFDAAQPKGKMGPPLPLRTVPNAYGPPAPRPRGSNIPSPGPPKILPKSPRRRREEETP